MKKFLIFSVILAFSVLAEEIDSYKEGSDAFFQSQVDKLGKGSLKERIDAIGTLKKHRTLRALRPLILAVKGSVEIDADLVSLKENDKMKEKMLTPSEVKDGGFGFYDKPEVIEKASRQVLNPETVIPLDANISEHNAPILKYLASQAIADLGHSRGMQPLVDVFYHWQDRIKENDKPTYGKDENMRLVVGIAEVLRSIGTLIDNMDVKEESADEKKDKKKTPILDSIKVGIDTLTFALGHPNYFIRAAAADGLRNTYRKEGMDKLLERLKAETDASKKLWDERTNRQKNIALAKRHDYVTVAILSAIIGIEPHASEKFLELTEMLKHDDPYIRMRASIGLGDSGISNAEHYLRQALRIEDNMLVREQLKRDIKAATEFFPPSAPTNALFKDGKAEGNMIPTGGRKRN